MYVCSQTWAIMYFCVSVTFMLSPESEMWGGSGMNGIVRAEWQFSVSWIFNNYQSNVSTEVLLNKIGVEYVMHFSLSLPIYLSFSICPLSVWFRKAIKVSIWPVTWSFDWPSYRSKICEILCPGLALSIRSVNKLHFIAKLPVHCVRPRQCG